MCLEYSDYIVKKSVRLLQRMLSRSVGLSGCLYPETAVYGSLTSKKERLLLFCDYAIVAENVAVLNLTYSKVMK